MLQNNGQCSLLIIGLYSVQRDYDLNGSLATNLFLQKVRRVFADGMHG